MAGNLIKAGTKAAKSGLSWLQEVLPGVRPVRGVERVTERPGMYSVNPSEMVDSSWLRRAERQMADEARLAEYGTSGIPSTSGVERARAPNMLLGALNELRYASMRGTPRPSKEAVKGVVYVDKSGNVKGGAAINREKAGEYLADKTDLDFTRAAPNYLEYVSTTSPEVRGSDILREIQKLYGDDMVFQVANPKKNVAIYEAMGAKRMPLTEYGYDVLDGSPNLPAFRIESRIPERGARRLTPEDLEALGQERLPGFNAGGVVRKAASGLSRWVEEMFKQLPPKQSAALLEGIRADEATKTPGRWLLENHPTIADDLRNNVSPHRGGATRFMRGGLVACGDR